MPISGPSSYLPTIDDFLTHWREVNTQLRPNGMILASNYDITSLSDDREALFNATTDQQSLDNAVRIAGAERDIVKAKLLARAGELGRMVRAYFGGTRFGGTVLPKVPSFSTIETKFLTPMEDFSDLWTKINSSLSTSGFTPPLLLSAGYSLDMFKTDINILRSLYADVRTADGAAKLNRGRRSEIMAIIRPNLVNYRQMVAARFLPGSALVASLPALSPPKGTTPDPVEASATWDATEKKARLTWTRSENPKLEKYTIRTSPGPVYKADDEAFIADIPVTETSFLTSDGLTAPGATALYRVYVVLTTGNERGSKTLKVARPE